MQPTIDNGWISDHDRRRVHVPFREEKEPFIHQRLRAQARGLFFILPFSTLRGTDCPSYSYYVAAVRFGRPSADRLDSSLAFSRGV